MNDPTYVKSEIEANPTWRLAFFISEIDNDTAPIGWGRYISIAESVKIHTAYLHTAIAKITQQLEELTADYECLKSAHADVIEERDNPWQSIITAPRDGTPVDLWAGERLANCFYDVDLDYPEDSMWRQRWAENPEGSYALTDLDHEPTHWMAIAKGPQP